MRQNNLIEIIEKEIEECEDKKHSSFFLNKYILHLIKENKIEQLILCKDIYLFNKKNNLDNINYIKQDCLTKYILVQFNLL